MAGGTISRTAHFVLHRAPLDTQEPWIGAVIPKRWAKRAVTRNGIKRQIYNVSASFEPRLAAAAHVVRLRTGFARSEFASAWSDALKVVVRGELLQLFEQARK